MTFSASPEILDETFACGSARLQVLARCGRPDIAEVFVGAFEGRPDARIEFVDGLDPERPRRDKWIINISTQAGCPIGCRFCDAGGGFHGNLGANELLAQALYVSSRHPEEARTCAKLKVHFARMGEPALNDAVPDALARLPEAFGNPNLWGCVATIAPAGREAWFERLREVKEEFFRGRFQLQFSVNSTDDAERAWLMPARLWSFRDIARYGEAFHRPGDRRVVLNFALAEGVSFEAAKIMGGFDPRVFALKLTPLNPTQRAAAAGMRTVFRGGNGRPGIEAVCEELSTAGYDIIISVGDSREDLIGSNCGQAVLRLAARL